MKTAEHPVKEHEAFISAYPHAPVPHVEEIEAINGVLAKYGRRVWYSPRADGTYWDLQKSNPKFTSSGGWETVSYHRKLIDAARDAYGVMLFLDGANATEATNRAERIKRVALLAIFNLA